MSSRPRTLREALSTGDLVALGVGVAVAAVTWYAGVSQTKVRAILFSIPFLCVSIWRGTPWGAAEKRTPITSLNDLGPKARIVPWHRKLLGYLLLIVGGLIGCAALMALIAGFSVPDGTAMGIGVVGLALAAWMVSRGLRLG